MKRLTLIGFVTLLFSHALYAQELAERINALIQKQLPQATIAILIKDAKTGEVIYQKNSKKLVSPASNMKLFVAAAALLHLNLNYGFLTTLSQKSKDIYITFNGSPSLTLTNFIDLLLHLKKMSPISGNIILDVSHFKPPYYPNGTSYDDIGWYYSAPDTAVIINENAESFEVKTAEKIGSPVIIKPKNDTGIIQVENRVITVSKDQARDHCALDVAIKKNNRIRLYGCLAQQQGSKIIQLAITNPVSMAYYIIKKTLKQNNILLKGRIVRGKTPAGARVIFQYQSDSLVTLIIRMLQESDNLYANSLTKELGYSVTKEGSYKQGVFAIKKILKENTNLDMSQMVIADGEGTRYNLVTAEQVVLLLTNIFNNKTLRPIFITALPQSGVSGTLKDRMKKTVLEKNVFAKTGTMHDISSLSGYIVIPKGRTLIFSMIINGVNKPINLVKDLEDKILMTVVQNVSLKSEFENMYG